MSHFLQPLESFLKEKSTVALASLCRMGVEGCDLPPVLISGIIEGTDLSGVIVALPCAAIIDTGNWNITPVKEKPMADSGLKIGSKYGSPSVV